MDNSKMDYFALPGSVITFDSIVNQVCDFFKVKREQVFSRSRKREYLDPRQIIHYLTKKHFPRTSLAKIGQMSGGWDHATVLSSNRTVKNLSETSEFYKTQIVLIEQKINGTI